MISARLTYDGGHSSRRYDSLGRPNRAESDAVEARQELDLKVGVAFSRFQTRYFQGRYADLDAGVLSHVEIYSRDIAEI
jgi:DNA topoisomerase IA